MGTRGLVVVLVMGLGLAWLAILAGGELHGETLSVGLSIFAAIVSALIFWFYYKHFIQGGIQDGNDAVATIIFTFCLSFIFGVIVAPIGNIAGIKAWLTPWDILLVAGLVPLIWNIVLNLNESIYYPG